MDSLELLAASIIGAIIFFVILYQIIKAAVFAGTQLLYKEMKIHNQFKIREMKKQGNTEEEIQKDIDNGNK